jgi:hypothetical protein
MGMDESVRRAPADRVGLERLMAWIRLSATIIIFATICAGWGYFAEYWVRRRKWPGWILGLMVLAVAVLWPVVVVCWTIYDASNYLSQHPHDDGPGMVVVSMITVGAPFLFVASFPPTVAGVLIGRHRNSKRSIEWIESAKR